MIFTTDWLLSLVNSADKSVVVIRGGTIQLDCNNSTANATQIDWYKDGHVISSFSSNKTFYNFSIKRLMIDKNSFSRLSILNAQDDDEGLYSCRFTWRKGSHLTSWNVIMSDKPEKGLWSTHWYLWIILAVGLSLCCSLTVCLSRRYKTRTSNQDPVQGQFQPQPVEQEDLTPPQRTHNKRQSKYMERLNSLYGHI